MIMKIGGNNKTTNVDQHTSNPGNLPDTVEAAVNKVLPDKNKYETIEIVNRDVQLDTIVQYIAGEEWVVDYYLQLIAKDNEIGLFDPNSPDVSKQYMLMKDTILYVDTTLTQNKAQELTGSAMINAGVVPNPGDVFVALLMGKRKALISITNVEKRTYNLNNVFYIEYKLDMFLDNNDNLLNTLNNKVVKTYYYDKDFLLTNGSPILLENEFKHKKKITISIKEIINYYFETMFNSERATLSIPGQDNITVDVFLQEYIFKTINSTDSIYISKIARNIIPDDVMRQNTILDAFIHRDIDILKSCNRKVTYIDSVAFANNIRLRNIAYLGIKYLAYPVQPDSNIMSSYVKSIETYETTLKDVPNPYRANKGKVDNLIPNIDKTNKFYIFTEDFYNLQRTNLTKLEVVALQYLYQEPIDNGIIVEILDDYKYWDRVQQYYFIPILIIILRDIISRNSSIS